MDKKNPVTLSKMIKAIRIMFEENQESDTEILMFRYTFDPGCVHLNNLILKLLIDLLGTWEPP